jgi:hypothetical protein
MGLLPLTATAMEPDLKSQRPLQPIVPGLAAKIFPSNSSDRWQYSNARVGCLRGLNHGVVREFDSDRKETHSAEAEAGSIALLRAARQNIAFLNAMLRSTLTTRSNDKCPHPCGLKLFLTQ